ncbi:polysialyltransferase family glycosyltransferase [Vibrio sp. 10N]|uniref:polysialyltransferase family glycosyltransferase n=1 Tax=Vibrio sp. 10N TaxID=3058938 RepID=UPI002813377F|nr:hypothetical protein VB10N_28640 [Vibrio sp. 10N]
MLLNESGRVLVGVNINSPYQLMSFVSYFQANANNFERAVVFKRDVWGYNQIYQPYLDLLSTLNIQLIEQQMSPKSLGVYFKDEGISVVTLVIINDVNPQYYHYSGLSVELVIIADGLGYYGDARSRFLATQRESDFSKLALFKTALNYYIKKVYDSLRNPKRFTIAEVKQNIVINNDYTYSLKSVFDKVILEPQLKRPALIFVSQPLVKLGLMSQQAYDDHLDFLQRFADNKGLDFFIKPHPSEIDDLRKYNIFNSPAIIEHAMYYESNIKCVVGFSSTSLINIKLLYDVEVWRLDLLDASLSSKQNKLLNMIDRLEFSSL